MSNISDLPNELLADVLTIALEAHPTPTDVFRVNARFHSVGELIVYSHPQFRSCSQMLTFASATLTPRLGCLPRTLSMEIPQHTFQFFPFHPFELLLLVLKRCGAKTAEQSETGQVVQVPLDVLKLRVITHAIDPRMEHLDLVLGLVNPTVFTWNPDTITLEHHFSIAIVPAATYHFLRAAATWTNVQEITLTNVAFSSRDTGLDTAGNPLLPVIPSLRKVTFDRATLLPPERVASMVCLPGQDKLEMVRLVDAYSDSIWGPRIRRSDVEKAAIALGFGDDACLAQIRRVVRCEAKTERIMGGDRAEGFTVLE